MTWREQLVARILLLVARMLCDDPQIAHELKALANHIQVYAPPEEAPWSEEPS